MRASPWERQVQFRIILRNLSPAENIELEIENQRFSIRKSTLKVKQRSKLAS